jgi:hypothetical protein
MNSYPEQSLTLLSAVTSATSVNFVNKLPWLYPTLFAKFSLSEFLAPTERIRDSYLDHRIIFCLWILQFPISRTVNQRSPSMKSLHRTAILETRWSRNLSLLSENLLCHYIHEHTNKQPTLEWFFFDWWRSLWVPVVVFRCIKNFFSLHRPFRKRFLEQLRSCFNRL